VRVQTAPIDITNTTTAQIHQHTSTLLVMRVDSLLSASGAFSRYLHKRVKQDLNKRCCQHFLQLESITPITTHTATHQNKSMADMTIIAFGLQVDVAAPVIVELCAVLLYIYRGNAHRVHSAE
jgi:hypothetical protein